MENFSGILDALRKGVDATDREDVAKSIGMSEPEFNYLLNSVQQFTERFCKVLTYETSKQVLSDEMPKPCLTADLEVKSAPLRKFHPGGNKKGTLLTELKDRQRCDFELGSIVLLSCEFDSEFCEDKIRSTSPLPISPKELTSIKKIEGETPTRAIFDTGMGVTHIGLNLAKDLNFSIPPEHENVGYATKTIANKSQPWPAIAMFKVNCGLDGWRVFKIRCSVSATTTYAKDIVIGLGDIVPNFDFSFSNNTFEHGDGSCGISFWLTNDGRKISQPL